ncbi:hypothetical protein K439DRAFT_457967 [Ramaria rubella]|nr:hypothetical protein K439DRAFT_457967 [Ramaria rubella]
MMRYTKMPYSWRCDKLIFVHCHKDSSFFRFEDLVFDIQVYIVAFFVPVQDLHSLTQVSRYIGSLAAPALYTDVKLLFGRQPPVGSPCADGAFTKALISAQRSFKKEIFSRSEHARHVRSLAWQVCSTGACNHAFSEFFPLFSGLRRIHLVDPHPTHICELNHPPPTLFPRIKHVKITGTTSVAFVMPLLHSPQGLTSLSLDTINPHSVHIQLLQFISSAGLSSLRTLSLRAVCQQPWNDTRESELLSEWKTALIAVRHTLQRASFGFRTQVTGVQDAWLPSLVEKFTQVVMIVFWEEMWPQLKTVHLEGIDTAPEGFGESTEFQEALVRLRDAASEVVLDPTIRSVQRIWTSDVVEKF